MLGEELHSVLCCADPKLVLKWALMFAQQTNYHEDHSCTPTQMTMEVFLHKDNSDGKTLFICECNFIKYLFAECEVEAVTKLLKRFLNLKAFL